MDDWLPDSRTEYVDRILYDSAESSQVAAYLEEYRKLRRTEIGASIRRVRESSGWSQQQVADVLRHSRSHIHRVEQGLTELGVADLELLAVRFNVPLRVLLGGGPEYWDSPRRWR
jgi:ribosome-binding protein aMBF1 (putative translation factor)